ncbi:universal stress protein [Kitasatospora sp. NPDC093806]|uniref:universal stress protein n=1 Tax=Kitasatospora sp. NPDC093806 TaxID=3155075 RepID=UPI003438FC04
MSDGARVIVGVSGSLHSLTALHRAADEARERRAVLVPVFAWTPVGGEYNYRLRPCPPLLRAWQDAAETRMRHALDEAFGGLPAGVRMEPQVVRGEAGPVLTALADRPDDLLVIGTGRQDGALRSTVRRLFRGGSVSRYCLTRARCTVLAVPPSTLEADLRALRRGVDMRELAALVAA